MADSRVPMGSGQEKPSPEDAPHISNLKVVLERRRDLAIRPLFHLRPVAQWSTAGKLFDEFVVEWQLSDAGQN